MKIIKYGGNALNDKNNRKLIYKQIKNEKAVLIVSAFKNGPYSTSTLKSLITNNYTTLMNQQLIILGEIISSIIVTNELLNEGIDATIIYPYELGIYVNFNDKMEDIISLDNEIIKQCIDKHQIVVIPGFIGINQDDYLVSLNEGGSDLTAILVAKMLDCNEVFLKKDVLGLASINPKYSKDYKLYQHVSYDTMLLLASHGNKLIQEDALKYAKDYKINIHINHFLNNAYDTLIQYNSKERVITFSIFDNFVYIDGYDNTILIENYLIGNHIPFDYIMNLKSSLKIVTSYKNQEQLLSILHTLFMKGELK